MAEVVVFGGTTEGRQLAQWCSDQAIPALVCVATELGEKVLPAMPGVTSHVGRLDRAAMAELLDWTAPTLVVDATHPYATQVTATLSEVCADLGLRQVRVTRATGEPFNHERTRTDHSQSGQRASQAAFSGAPTTAPVTERPGIVTVANITAAVEQLSHTTGVVFATTGANEARALTRLPDFQQRVVLRILPTVESVGACLELGYPVGHLVAMQGPFDHDLNVALFRHFDAAIMVTKDSGDIGGFNQKLSAAADCGLTTVVIARPPETAGVSLAEAEALITEVTRGQEAHS